MIKRVIFIIILSLFLTGCKVEYKVDLDSQLNIKENIQLISTSEDDKEKFADFSLHIPVSKNTAYGAFLKEFDGVEYYNYKKNTSKIMFNYNYKNDNYKDYNESTLGNYAYEYISVNKLDNGTLFLSTSKKFLLFEKYDNLEEVKVTINTTYKALKNNADEVNNHSYTWIITKDNAYGKGIYLKLDTTKEDLTLFEKIMRGDYLNIFTLALTISLIVFLAYKFFKKYSQKRDEI